MESTSIERFRIRADELRAAGREEDADKLMKIYERMSASARRLSATLEHHDFDKLQNIAGCCRRGKK